MIQKIIVNLIDRQKAISEIQEFSDSPGIYAFFYIGKTRFPLEKFVIPDHKIIYIGKTEKSQKSRDANTHFKTGKTGSSTVRKSIGALLSQSQTITPIIRSLSDVEKRRTSHYKFDEASEKLVTHWMFENLGVSFFEYPKSKEEINQLETDIIRTIYPVLNIDSKNDKNPYKTYISGLRKQLGLVAHDRANYAKEIEAVENKSKSLNKMLGSEKTVSKQPSSIRVKNFMIPSLGNTITKNDIEKTTLRITVDLKPYFPNRDSIVKIMYADKSVDVLYKITDSRSNLLKIGKDVIQTLKLKANESLTFEIIESKKKFRIKKLIK